MAVRSAGYATFASSSFCAEAPDLFSDLEATTNWNAVIAAEPVLEAVISDEQRDGVLEAIGDFIDLKSPYTIGHSRNVADLASAHRDGLPDDELSGLP